ncbi:MAG: hypothetical protein DRP46_08590 [Candidatus Zixiibacteriota bacterium]|nr:MAG: hypothetical protein DRP46_08590 [candidate division Zixibacteria bacterium]
MRRTAIILILAALIIFAAALNVSAQAPNTIMYQGRLTNADGTPMTGVVDDVRFRIYSGDHDAILKAIYYEQTSAIECDENGVFTIELGPITNPNATAGYARYLGIKVGTDDEMIPYQKLTSTLYSISTAEVPGIAAGWYNGGYITLTSSAINLDSAVIEVPTNGYMVVIANAYYVPSHVNGIKDLGRFTISTESELLDYNNMCNISTPADVATNSDLPLPVSVHAVYQVTPGLYTYYFTADAFSGTPRVNKARITAMFFPTAYGTVDATGTKKATEQLPNTDSGNMSK